MSHHQCKAEQLNNAKLFSFLVLLGIELEKSEVFAYLLPFHVNRGQLERN